ncbi:MAG: hypothetical protein QG653_688 [Patescibacteria group bacterium]|nr:hypothetical protein [Patescibacteria group bacterium]
MNIFRKKRMALAVESTLTPVVDSLQVITPEETALTTYPYYTGKVEPVKSIQVRFAEGKNAREVMDFNLFLTPNDVWVGAITREGYIEIKD